MPFQSGIKDRLALRSEVIGQLCADLPGKNLYELAKQYSVTITKGGKLNKGWTGQTIEHVAQLTAGNSKNRDGFDFELKSTSLVVRDGNWTPKETIKITQLNPQSILEEQFETSALWNKLASLIIVGCHHVSPEECTAVHISAIDISEPELTKSIRSFWEDVRHTVCSGEIADYYVLGNSNDYIQLRPTGTGRQWSTCPITGERFPSRAFYATKRLLKHVMKL